MDEYLIPPACAPKEHIILMQAIPGFCWHHEVGSAVFMEDADDIDYVVVIKPTEFNNACRHLNATGWQDCSADDYMMAGQWRAFRRDKLNFILCTNQEWAQRFANAAQVCKFLNIRDKETRVKVNWIIRDCFSAEAVREIHWEVSARKA